MTRVRNALRKCSEVTVSELNRQRLNLLRPGAKVVLFDGRGQVLFGRLPDGYPNRFNLPGGGVDDGETLAPALAREFDEEMEGPALSLDALSDAPILAEGRLPFARDQFVGKHEYIIGYRVLDVQVYKPKSDSKLVCFPPMPWRKAFMEIKSDTRVKRRMRIMYARAVRNVGVLMGV